MTPPAADPVGGDGPLGGDVTAAGEVVPLLRVLSGAPDGDELAAVVAVVAARLGAPAPEDPPAPVSRWEDPAHLLGVPLPGPDAWRTSGWAPR